MEVRGHLSGDEFRTVAEPLYRREPVVHTMELTALRTLSAGESTLLTIWDGGLPVGALLRTPPYPLLCNTVPPRAMDTVAAWLAEREPELPAVRGVRHTATAFAAAWRAITGQIGVVTTAERLYRLATLRVLDDVAGGHREATSHDRGRLVEWLDGFFADAGGEPPDPAGRARFVDTADSMGDRFVLRVREDKPVSMAMVRAPAAGVSRIGPVFTPRGYRGNGYGSAVCAAAASLALGIGAEDVVLFADLANPVSNAIYQRIGFRPVCDSVRIDLRVP